jgi:hypothetical protein
VPACLLVLAAQTVALLTPTQREVASRSHLAPIVVTAPAVVAESLADQADAMPDEPFGASWTRTSTRRGPRPGTGRPSVDYPDESAR